MAYMILDYITNLKQDIVNYVDVVIHNRKIIDNLQQRIDKAIKYIEKHSNSLGVLDTISNGKLLNILKGDSDE